VTKCGVNGNNFLCDVSIIKGRLVINNLSTGSLEEYDLSSIVNVYRDGDLLILQTPTKKLYFEVSGRAVGIVYDVGRLVELRIKYDVLSTDIKELLLTTSKVLKILVDIVVKFSNDYLGRWAYSKSRLNDLYVVSNDLIKYGIDVKGYLDELTRNIDLRRVNDVRNSIKALIREVVVSVSKYLTSTLVFTDLRPILNVLVLAYTVELACMTNQLIECRRVEEELSTLCNDEVHIKLLNVPEVNICVGFIKSLRSKDSYEAVNEFIENFLNVLSSYFRPR
jgi:hypothetical protein